jgi:hypothetical protein
MPLLGMFLVAALGLLALLAVREQQKRIRREGRFVTPSLEPGDPTFDAVAERLARAAFPLQTELQMGRDYDGLGLVALIRGLDPGIRLDTTGRTTGNVEVGHRGFDQQVSVQGETAMVRARLDGPTRDALLELSRRAVREGQLTVADGQLRAVVPPNPRVSLADPTDETVPLLARVAHRLADRIDEVAELAKNARHDPLSGVRVVCLRTLLREYPKHPSVGPLLREATRDADAEVRLEAATALGVDGVAALNALVGDPSVEDDLAARAAESLGPRIDAAIARATLRREMAATALRRPATALACTAALGLHGDPQDEALLLALVSEERDESLRLASVRALGHVGSAQAVPSLAELESSASPDLRRAGREAIATIQSRLHGATPGQLSLDEDVAGQVALADDAAGRLSEAPEEHEG